MQGWKMLNWKTWNQTAVMENARKKNAGPTGRNTHMDSQTVVNRTNAVYEDTRVLFW